MDLALKALLQEGVEAFSLSHLVDELGGRNEHCPSDGQGQSDSVELQTEASILLVEKRTKSLDQSRFERVMHNGMAQSQQIRTVLHTLKTGLTASASRSVRRFSPRIHILFKLVPSRGGVLLTALNKYRRYVGARRDPSTVYIDLFITQAM